MNFDAITVAPYMGEDSVRPFLEYENKWTIVLGLTSNPGSADFELKKIVERTEILEEGVHVTKQVEQYLYESVLQKTATWGTEHNLMFVVGATQAEAFTNIRKLTPGHFYLVPGVGAQGGSLEEISRLALNAQCGLLVNSSRQIIYAGQHEDFAQKARQEALGLQQEMAGLLARYLPR